MQCTRLRESTKKHLTTLSYQAMNVIKISNTTTIKKSTMPTPLTQKHSDTVASNDLTTLKTILAGAIFGGALTAAGVYHPSVIIGQLKLQDFTMLKVFLTATATSAFVIPIAKYLHFTNVQPRGAMSLGWFHNYDANIMGGAMMGAGMALTGACPGTVLPQIVTGVRSGLWVGIGGLIGALQFIWKIQYGMDCDSDSPTMDKDIGLNRKLAILGYQVVCGTIIAGAIHFSPGNMKSLVPPIIGGLLIGGSQAASLFLTGRTLGVSTAYEQAALNLDWAFSNDEEGLPRPESGSMVFVGGILLGSWTLSHAVVLPIVPEVHIGALRALFGGSLMIFGARLASGCTSGHGISGMSQLSKSSFFTVAAMFGTGITVASVDDLITL